jgi:hypothetical protein
VPDCLLHIGVEKTGSTSIQITLSRNRPKLAAMGILYPQAFGEKNHVKAYAFASEDEVDELKSPFGLDGPAEVDRFREMLKNQLAQEIAAKRPRQIIISNEHCSSRLLKKSEIERLAALLHQHCASVKVVAYVRRQGDALRSAYSTYIKTGGTEPFLPPDQEEIVRKYDYEAILGRWAEVFGAENVEVRVFSRDTLASGDVVADFLTRIDLDPDQFTLVRERNKSLGRAGTEFLRRFNRLVPYTIGSEYNPARGNIQEIVEAFPDDVPYMGDPSTIARLDDDMAAANERLKARYLASQPGPLFVPTAARDEATAEADVDPDDIMRVMAFVWETKQQQVLRLKKRVEGLPVAGAPAAGPGAGGGSNPGAARPGPSPVRPGPGLARPGMGPGHAAGAHSAKKTGA